MSGPISPFSSRPQSQAFSSYITNQTSRTSNTCNNPDGCEYPGCTKHLPGGNDRWFNWKWDAHNKRQSEVQSKSGSSSSGQQAVVCRNLPRRPSSEISSLKSETRNTDLSRQARLNVVREIKQFSDVFSPLARSRMRTIGQGGFGTVKIAKRRTDGRVCAVKTLTRSEYRSRNLHYETRVQVEFAIAKSLCHPNVVETFELCQDGPLLYIVMESCYTDLWRFKSLEQLSSPSRAEDRFCFFVQLIKGLQYLHHNGIAHHDLKSENILVTEEGVIKIADFGLSIVFSGEHPANQWYKGKLFPESTEIKIRKQWAKATNYWPPETHNTKVKYDPRGVDVWGAAMIMISLTAGRDLWTDMRRSLSNRNYWDLVTRWQVVNQCQIRVRGIVPRVKFLVKAFEEDEDLGLLIISMLNPDPTKRLTIEAVVDSPWFQRQQCCIVYNPHPESRRPFSVAAPHKHLLQQIIYPDLTVREKVVKKVKRGKATGRRLLKELGSACKCWRRRS